MSRQTTARLGSYMQTYTGQLFWAMDPRPEEVHTADIAHALSMQCRYNGHVSRFYSVAEHCVHMSRWVGERAGPEEALWALLHDATEAYVGDMVKPLKDHISQFIQIEEDLMRVICYRYGMDPRFPPIVVEADARILVDEQRALTKGSRTAEGLGVTLECWSPDVAEHQYLDRLQELQDQLFFIPQN